MTEQEFVSTLNLANCRTAELLMRGLRIMDRETVDLQVGAVACIVQLREILEDRVRVTESSE